VPDSRVFQIDGIHQVMESDVGVTAAQARHQGREESQESIEGIAAKRAEEQIEPHHIGFQFGDGLEDAKRAGGIVERPAALHGEAIEFGLGRENLIRKDGEAEETIATQFFGKMKAVLAQSTLAGRESCYQTDFHYSPASRRFYLDEDCRERSCW
jgi:hypothetical protein